MSDKDELAALGPLGLTLRLRRLADNLTESGRRLYRSEGVAIEPHWYAYLMLLKSRGELGVTELARVLRQSHPTVIAALRRMERAGLVAGHADPKDGRRRRLRLTPEAEERWPSYAALWQGFELSLEELLAPLSGSPLANLAAMEAALANEPLDARVARALRRRPTPRKQPKRDGKAIKLRPMEKKHREGVLEIAQELVRAGDTYAFDRTTSGAELWRYWGPGKGRISYVALRKKVPVGMFVLKRNHPGGGQHIANGSYAVRADMRGLGIGRLLGKESLALAKKAGFEGMQFNIVLASNRAALALWAELGFRVVGTIPNGFQLPSGKRVDHHILYRDLLRRPEASAHPIEFPARSKLPSIRGSPCAPGGG